MRVIDHWIHSIALAEASTHKTQVKSVHWGSPDNLVSAARKTMGSIQLDPASNMVHQRCVRAETWCSLDASLGPPSALQIASKNYLKGRAMGLDIGLDVDALGVHVWNGLSLDWSEWETVWLNPPYGNGIECWIVKFGREVKTGCLLVPNSTETEWFFEIWRFVSAILFVERRISFTAQNGKVVDGNPAGSIIAYKGNDVKAFTRNFEKFGKIIILGEERSKPQLDLL